MSSSQQQPDFELRTLREESAPDYFTLYSLPEIGGGTPPFLEDETAAEFLNRIQSLCTRHFGIYPGPDYSKLIGDCALHHWDVTTRSIEIGGALLPEYQGRGIMQAAFSALIAMAQTELHARQIIGRTRPDNQAAIRLVRKLGFGASGVRNDEAAFILEFT